MHFRSVVLRTVSAFVLGLGIATPLIVSSPAAAAVADGPTIAVTGHGYGHGRGMGQYGAYGYARDHNWTSDQILDHFYGGTVAGTIPASASISPAAVRVELREERGRPLVVGLASGTIGLLPGGGGQTEVVESGYVRLTRQAAGYVVESGTSCSGPWAPKSTFADTTIRLVAQPPSTTGAASTKLHVCEASGVTWYGGDINAVFHNGISRVVNVVSLETYLRGVVPREIPASWTAAALQVQSVAARSYVMAGDTRQQPYADTCNTTLCQVYDGLYQSSSASGPAAVTRTSTDSAIVATAGIVRRSGNNIARTEFSSSTGGHTAGGTFPAVVDAGDAVSANPNNNWSTVANLTSLESQYDLGRLKAMVVTKRNGLGADGGRVQTVRLDFDEGSVTRTGSSIRIALGLKSDWFSLGSVVRPIDETHSLFIEHAYRTFADRTPSGGEKTYWLDVLEVNGRHTLVAPLVNSDEWAGVVIDDLYRRALGRGADGGGRSYWISVLSGNTRLEFIGVQFYGSREYFLRSGGTNASFINQLYRDVLLREPDAGGRDYWVSQIERGAGYDAIAASFYYSVESRRTRASDLFESILGRTPGNSETEQWADELLRIDDLDLAVVFGSSDEFFQNAQ